MKSQKMFFSPWITCDINLWKSLYADSLPRLYKKNKIILHQNSECEGIYIVVSGRIRVTVLEPQGNEIQLCIAEKGSICCGASAILRLPNLYTCIALTDCQCYFIPLNLLLKQLKVNPSLNMNFMEYLARKNAVLTQKVTELSFMQSSQRIASLLIALCNQYGKEEQRGTKISIKFTHQDVAGMVNTSRVTVSNVINYFIKKDIVEKVDGHFIIKDIDKLFYYIDTELHLP